MARLTRTVVEQRIEALNKEAQDKINVLAAQWRTEVLIPWCRRNGFTILIGNGDWKFYNQKREYFGGWEQNRFKIIHETMNQPGVGHGDYFGYHVESVNEDDLT